MKASEANPWTLFSEIAAELQRARDKFPGDNVTFLALAEEHGELAKAMFEESRERVRKEAIQVAVMACRVVLDGDCTVDAWREKKGLDPLLSGVESLAAVSPVSDDRVRELEEKLNKLQGNYEHLGQSIGCGDHWVWEECGENDLKSMGEHVRVSMTAAQLKKLIKWQETNRAWADCHDMRKERDEARAELSTLRAQLEGQWELGEPLTYQQWDESNPGASMIIRHESGELTQSFAEAIDWHSWKKDGATIHLDPRPLPTLPSEPEPEVPAPETPQVLWSVRSFDKLFGWHTRWYVDETDADDYMNTLDESDRATKKPFSVTPLSEEPTDA